MIEVDLDRFWNKINAEIDVTLDDENRKLLCSIFHAKQINKDTFFIREGDKSTNIAMIINGVFRSFYIDAEGNDITKYFYTEGSLLISYLAHISNKNSTYYIQAIEDSEVLVASLDEFDNTINGNIQLQVFYKKLIDRILVMKEEHALSFKMMDSFERYKYFCDSFPGLEKRIKQHHLASYLGITPVTLSRIRTKNMDREP